MKIRRSFLSALCVLVVCASASLRGAPECDDLTQWVPDDVIAYAKVHGLGPNLRGLLDSKLLEDLRGSMVGRMIQSDEKFQDAMRKLDEFRQTSERDPVDLLDDLLGEEAIVAVRMNLFVPEVVMLTRAKSEERLDAARKALERAFEARAGFLPTTEKVTFEGHTVEKLDKVLFTYLGRVVAISNSETMLQSVIRLADGQSDRSVRASTVFAGAISEKKKRGLVEVVARPRYVPNFEIPREADNAVGSLLAQGFLGSLASSELLTVSLRVASDGLRLTAKSQDGPQGLEEKYSAFFPKVAPSGLRERLERHGVLGCVELHRDLARWWESSEALLEPRAQGDLVQFAQGASLFFGGLSFQDEVLPKIGDRVLFVARNQSYEGFPAAPEPAIPGFALVFEIEEASEFGRQFEVAFNSLVGIVNIDRMQKKKGGPTLLVRPVKIGSTDAYTVDMGLPASKEGKRPGIEYNFTPSMAVVGERVVLSSSEELLRILVAEIEQEKAAPGELAPARDRLVLDAAQIGDIVAKNLDFFAAENMVKKGISLDEARNELQALLEILSFLRDLQVVTEREGRATELGIRLRLADGPSATRTTRVNVGR